MTGLLVRNLQRSEESRLRRFFQRRFRCREEAADATQETFLRMLSLGPETAIDNPQAYLFRVARSVAYAWSARRAADDLLFDRDAALDLADDQPDAERAVDARQRLRAFSETIAALPPRCREAFVMSRFEGLANSEIALRLGISRNMVEKHVMRALLACRATRSRLS
ncbi:RNA polymerase sigma factor [Chenggangzhangella methanolivorans]|uniref:Sigma-70 family RNA polymerase sigma factor n=1 Tax=Chenggangzhangella methanolivorans TaxID=1437009 RepID=A0A9E6UJM3_9HYPH|nr:sigma-70 family RNA polymerase sigma factor [Chenggangzhangella methanolivorans]QZO02148.1 sigma-70 family RNA polymerase sigma factor [Chenggangzhangella methanolivorans]